MPLSQINMSEPNDDDSDTDPVKVGSPVEYVYRLHLEFPPKYTERAPLPFAMKRDYGHYDASYKADANVFTAERTLVTSMNELPALRNSDYIAFRRAVLQDAEQHLSIDSSAAPTPERCLPGRTYACRIRSTSSSAWMPMTPISTPSSS